LYFPTCSFLRVPTSYRCIQICRSSTFKMCAQRKDSTLMCNSQLGLVSSSTYSKCVPFLMPPLAYAATECNCRSSILSVIFSWKLSTYICCRCIYVYPILLSFIRGISTNSTKNIFIILLLFCLSTMSSFFISVKF